MPTWPLVAGRPPGVITTAGTTAYGPPCGTLVFRGDEAYLQAVARDTYTLAGLYVRVIANTTTGASTARSRKNGGNGAQSVSIPAGTTGIFRDTTNSDALVDGDLFNIQIVVGAGGDVTWSVTAFTLATPVNTTPIIMAASTGRVIAFGSTVFISFTGHPEESVAEIGSQYRMRVRSTLSNLRVSVAANDLNGDSTARTRVNGGNGAQSVSIGAATTGTFEDIANTDAIVPGDLVNHQLVTGGDAGEMGYTAFALKLDSTGRQAANCNAASSLLAFGLTRHLALEGLMSSVYGMTAIEADAQAAAQTPFLAKNVFVRIATNTLDGPTTYTFRRNGANGNLSVSVPAAATGTFEDLIHSDNVLPTDDVDWMVVSGGTEGNIAANCVGLEERQPSGIAAVNMAAKLVGAGLI